MSAKNLDKHNRFRCITVGFRVSPEEQEEINRAVSLSGLTKQEYCYQKCMNRDIVVQPNPRVHKALKVQMEECSKCNIVILYIHQIILMIRFPV